MAYPTNTSEVIILNLTASGHKLSEDDKDMIRTFVWDCSSKSYAEGNNSNGCDCGQPSCGYCN